MSEISRRGRILAAIERACICLGRAEVSTSEIMQVAFALQLHQGRVSARDRRLYSRSILRAAPRLCDRIGRARSRGAPWLWRLREPHLTLREMLWRQRMKKPSRN